MLGVQTIVDIQVGSYPHGTARPGVGASRDAELVPGFIGFKAEGLGLRVWDLGLRVLGLRLRVYSLGLWV